MEVALRIPRLKAPYVVVLFAAIAFPLIWWGPPLLVAFGAALGLAALFWIAGVPSPAEGAPASEPATIDTPAPPASLDLGSITATHRTTASIAAVAIALMALVSGIDDPVLSVKIALSSLLVLHHLSAPALERSGVFRRYGDGALDLCDVLSSFDARGKIGLDALCRIRSRANSHDRPAQWRPPSPSSRSSRLASSRRWPLHRQHVPSLAAL
jgi:hypothetical protein